MEITSFDLRELSRRLQTELSELAQLAAHIDGLLANAARQFCADPWCRQSLQEVDRLRQTAADLADFVAELIPHIPEAVNIQIQANKLNLQQADLGDRLLGRPVTKREPRPAGGHVDLF